MIAAADRLAERAEALRFGPPVSHAYNPLIYARLPHRLYLERYGRAPKKVLFLGMNPGPWGMAQTGIPFGEVEAVRGWLRIEAPVGKPEREHPKRPILGFDCPRSEVSGRRLWGLFRKRFVKAENFFQDHFVANYCPLVFMTSRGGNITPDKLSTEESRPLFAACDEALAETIEILKPRWVIGVGKFAEKRITLVRSRFFSDAAFAVASILHPSPASPRANRDWEGEVSAALVSYGVWQGISK